MIDAGVKDSNQMGSAMAPAAVDTILTHLEETGRTLDHYDLVCTGDLGFIGKSIVRDLLEDAGVSRKMIADVYDDCGAMIYAPEQDIHSGGSGCGCSASIFAGYVYRNMKEGKIGPVSYTHLRGFDEYFYAPHSRHTEVLREDIQNEPALRILADSQEVGPHIISTENGRQIFVMGHQEYDKGTLAGEYRRDVDKGLEIDVPKNYFENDDPEGEILFRWRAHASLLSVSYTHLVWDFWIFPRE